jgi:hypothetical protein
MQTLVTYRYNSELSRLVEMREYLEGLGLKPKFVVDHLELTLVGHKCGPLETLGWKLIKTTVGALDSNVANWESITLKQQKVNPKPLILISKPAQKRLPKSQRRLEADKRAWELDRQLKEKARAELKLDQTPLAKPVKVAASLIKEIEEHNNKTPAKRKRSWSLKGGTTYETTLRSRRPYCIHLDCVCSNCREWNNPVYKYKETSRGLMYLCHRCNEILRERSFGSRGGDAMFAAVGRNRAR